eukprot:GHVH01004242.1.p1 GENE.GHVH01004242.1~~GHVH01004242.1.p1  ORF type:complete len:574 (+),score=118.63 GHVH01004242.1:49-1770(+)
MKRYNETGNEPSHDAKKVLTAEASASLTERPSGVVTNGTPGVFAPDHATKVKQYRANYISDSVPFPACAMDGLFDEPFLKKAREECISNLEVTVKNTDLYEKMQSLDLAQIHRNSSCNASQLNLDEDTTSLDHIPHLSDLYKALKSDSMKQIISDVTGVSCDELCGEVDATVHVYGEGHHLLIHDDNIGTRKVAYILYLNDPEDAWKDEDGGALELYPLDGPHPATEPSARLLPQWNRMSIFEVQPNTSWHAVQEIRNPRRLRLSIQGWFHSKKRSDELTAKDLSVDEIINIREEVAFKKFAKELPVDDSSKADPVHDESCLTAEDIEHLSGYLDDKYLTRNTIGALRSRFIESNGILVLQDYLKSSLAKKYLHDLFDGDSKAPLSASLLESDIVSPPTFHRYVRWKQGHVLSDLKDSLFDTQHFRRYLTEITGLDPDDEYFTDVRQYRRGTDYVLAVAPSIDSRLDATFVLVDDCNEANRAKWLAGETGGNEVLVPAAITADGTESDDGAVAEAEGRTVTLETSSNSLTIVLRPEEVPAIRYLKFLKSSAPSDRFEISSEFKLKSVATDEEE